MNKNKNEWMNAVLNHGCIKPGFIIFNYSTDRPTNFI